MAKKEKRAVQNVQTSAPISGACVVIHAPFRPIEAGEYVCRHVTTRLTPRAAEQLKVIFKGLYEEHRTLSTGRHIDIPAHVVCWLLENIQRPADQPVLATVVIQAPCRPMVSGEHVGRSVDAQLTRLAAENLKSIFKGLYEEHRTLSNGRHIDIPAHAICWLLENTKTESVKRSLAS